LSFLFTLDEDKLAEQLPDIFSKYEALVQSAEPLFNLDGQRLELLLRNLPLHQASYDQKSQDMKQLMKWLENYKAKLEFIHLKNYSKGPRALSATDQKIFLGGEHNIIETNQLIIEATLIYNHLTAIVEAFRTMSWTLGHITKLRVSELNDIII
jgi:hypothetical protein